MPAKDVYHDAVKNALIKDGWTITSDPYTIEYEDDNLYADLLAEKSLLPEQQKRIIVVEIKSFINPSPMNDFQNALGQYLLYRDFLEFSHKDMDKIIKYRELIKSILTEYDQLVHKSPDYNTETCLVFDETHDHYLWLTVDWKEDKRLKSTHVHIRIKNEKIYIEEDWTEEGIANELLTEGVPKSDIVLAFHDPETRKLTEFAVV